ncbi:hypothetical protein BGW80DRAFT_922374 [Lactifluus volemus]|nr:hypothetical protein BGW80DRAFT_922374 [Lactifluus volemus]
MGGSASISAAATNKALPALGPLNNDFQAAPPSPPAIATATVPSAIAPVTALPSQTSWTSSHRRPLRSPTTYTPAQPTQPQTFGTFNTLLSPSSPQARPSSTPARAVGYNATPVMSPMSSRSATKSPLSAGTTSSVTTSATKSSGGGFDDLWSMSLGSAAASKPGGPGGSKSIRDLEKEKAQAGIWGVQNQTPSLAGGFGSFSKPAAPSVGGSGAPPGRTTCFCELR